MLGEELNLPYSLTMAFGAVSVLNLAIMSNNVAGRTKQVIASSLVFVAWAVGNAVGPQVFRSNDAPRYIKAFIAHLVVYCVQVAALFFLRLYLMRLNLLKRRAAALRETTASGEQRVGLLISFRSASELRAPPLDRMNISPIHVLSTT